MKEHILFIYGLFNDAINSFSRVHRYANRKADALCKNRKPQTENDVPFNIKRAVTDSNPLLGQEVCISDS
jgi:hypothetical protein